MACIENLHVNDYGTSLRVEVLDVLSNCTTSGVNLSNATTLQIILVKPSAEKVTKTANFVNDGSDGLIEYIVASGDLDEAGEWRIQSLVTFPSPSGSYYSDIGRFRVLPNL